VILGTVVPIGLGIVASTFVLAARGLDHAWLPAIVIGLITLFALTVLWRFLAAMRPDAGLEDALVRRFADADQLRPR
jgi:hypothetical protein